jgi:transcriptional antiterminator/mannitol/fructose-specific phosphotransferase system IIA component
MITRRPDINVRQQRIIRELLRTQGKITLSELAEKTDLNPRIIRYNMKVVCAWLLAGAVEFINKPGYGLEVVASEEAKQMLLEELNTLEDCDLILSKAQRIRIMLLYLLTSPEPFSAKSISEIENFSRSTVFKDTRDIEEWLSDYEIRLMKQSAKGLWIEGREASRRFALVRLVREELGDYRWHRLFNDIEKEVPFDDKVASHRFLGFLRSLRLEYTSSLIRFIEENINRCMSQKSRVEIMVYMGVMIHAMRSGQNMQGAVEDEAILTTEEFATARILGYMIEQEFGFSFNEKELELLAALIIGSRWEESPQAAGEQSPETPLSQKYDQITQQMINICSMRLHPMLKIDHLLFEELKNHLEYSIFRLNYHIPIRNRNLAAIKEKYSEIYRVAENSIFILEKELEVHIPPEEIGFIAMYLLSALERLRTEDDSHLRVIIANNGVRATSSLLQSRLEYEFPGLRVVKTINSFEDIPISKEEGDVIISTLPIESAQLPVIQVQPFLERENISDIQHWIQQENQSKRKEKLLSLHEQTSLVDLIKLSHITFAKRVYSWQDMVALASQPLIHSGAIQERYLRAMVDVITDYGFYMYMGSGVLLLHAKPTDGVNHLCMSMLKLDKPFIYDQNTLPETDIIIVLGATDDNSHLKALFQLNELIQHAEFMDSIRAANKPAQIINTLWQWLPRLGEPEKTIL